MKPVSYIDTYAAIQVQIKSFPEVFDSTTLTTGVRIT